MSDALDSVRSHLVFLKGYIEAKIRIVELSNKGQWQAPLETVDKALAELKSRRTPSPEGCDEDSILRLEHLKRVKLEPDDFLILEHPGRLSDDCMKHLRCSIKNIFGEDRKLIVLEEGMKLGVVSPQEKSESHYQLDGSGRLICPHCKAETHEAYAVVPNLPCWKCGKPMEVTT